MIFSSLQVHIFLFSTLQRLNAWLAYHFNGKVSIHLLVFGSKMREHVFVCLFFSSPRCWFSPNFSFLQAIIMQLVLFRMKVKGLTMKMLVI